MRIHVLNGPNLNMLGSRDPKLYGSLTLDDICSLLVKQYPGVQFSFFQSNHEGELIDELQRVARGRNIDALMVNFGGLSHTSVALRDALELPEVPKVEVHLSNIHAREPYRHHSLSAQVCHGVVAGFGANSYIYGVQALLDIVKRAP
jgi:3-dehydroquinate dehydratase II